MVLVVAVRLARTPAPAVSEAAAAPVKARTTPSSVARSAVAAFAVAVEILRTSRPTADAARWALFARPCRAAPKPLLFAAPPDMATPIEVMLPTIWPASVAIALWAREVSAANDMTSGSAKAAILL